MKNSWSKYMQNKYEFQNNEKKEALFKKQNIPQILQKREAVPPIH